MPEPDRAPHMENMDDNENFEELVGNLGDLENIKPEDLETREKPIEEPANDPGTADVITVTATAKDKTPQDAGKDPSEVIVDDAPEKTPFQKRIDELTRKFREAERRADIAETRLSERDRLSDKDKPKEKDPDPNVATEGKPNKDDFDTYEEYYEALADWRADQKIAEFKKQNEESKQKAFITQKEAEFRSKMAKGNETYSDFKDVVFDNTVPITETVVSILRESEIPADIAYFLGKNRKEASEIARMTPIQAAKAIGKIEAEILADRKENPTPAAQPTKTISSAPPPIKPVKASAVVDKDPEKMDHEEYRKWRMSRGGR